MKADGAAGPWRGALVFGFVDHAFALAALAGHRAGCSYRARRGPGRRHTLGRPCVGKLQVLVRRAVGGAVAYPTNSILPSVVLHAGGNVLAYMDLLMRGRAEWQASSSPAPLIWETGADASFWISCVAALAVGAAAVWAYGTLARVART